MGSFIQTIQFPVRCDKEGFEAVEKVLGKCEGRRQERGVQGYKGNDLNQTHGVAREINFKNNLINYKVIVPVYVIACCGHYEIVL